MTNPQGPQGLDDLDFRLLGELQRDARTSLTDLAAAIQLSVSATRARMLALSQRGVIAGYTAAVDPSAYGFTLRAVVRMKVHGSLYDKVTTLLAEQPQIVRCIRVTGESCYMMEIVATGMPDLERITSELARVGSITTDLVYEIVVDRPVPAPVSVSR
jgi:Lrp/AsnC family leucine-responsive transcriptional regulator